MKKISLMGNSRFLGNMLIIMQGLLLVLISIFFMNRQYMEAWQNFPNERTAMTVYLKNVSKDDQPTVEHYLMDSANEHQLFISRRDLALKNDGTPSGYTFGIWGRAPEDTCQLTFLNRKVIDASLLTQLLTSESPDSTLGVDTGSIHSIADLPGFRFYDRIVIKKLPQLISDSGAVSGTYTILGTEEGKSAFIDGLAAVSGLTVSELMESSGGATTDSNFMRDILFIFLGAQIFLNLVFFLVAAVKNLPKQGKLALLGWSRIDFSKAILGRFFTVSFLGIIFFVPAGWLLSGWTAFSLALLGSFFAAGLVNVALVAIELAVAAIVILMTRELDAIRGRIPKKPLYVLGITAYLLISAGIVFCGGYVDQPLNYLSENARLSAQWQSVSQYQILRSISVGQDADAFTGQSNALDQDMYDWYSSIAGENGVYLIHTNFYGDDLLRQWADSGIYSRTPQNAFWYYTVSPNYLPNLDIQLSIELLEAAQSGVRLYLLPDTMDPASQDNMMAWLQESTSRGLRPGDIQTAFTKQPTFKFATYTPQKELFTWATDTDAAMTATAPVIYVATPENMRYFETESLKASGLESYIKFADAQTMAQYVQPSTLNTYHLTDNELIFTAVQNYIDGLQKEIGLTLLWFGMVFVVLILILAGLLLTLAAIFRIANQEKINVKKFLGFSFWQLYRTPVTLLLTLILLELGIMAALRSKFGFLLIAFVALLQLVIFIRYMARSEIKRLLSAFKGE